MTSRRSLHVCVAACLKVFITACGGSPTPPTPIVEGPAVHSITPNSGAIGGGTEVTIRGLRFAGGATVTIGGQAATDVTVRSAEELTAKTPAGAAGSTTVVVSVDGRSGSLANGFTYLVPPTNAPPVITAITAQGTRFRQPANFADLGETIDVTATVRDDETPVEQLEYNWTATAGSFNGTGAAVTWQAPGTADQVPFQVTITLRVIEKFGGGLFQEEVTGTRTVSVHDSAREVGNMARRFLTEFSRPQENPPWQDVMRDFNAAVCPLPSEVGAERDDVINHNANFFMHAFEIGPASVEVNFGGTCYVDLPGDACIAVPVVWDSTHLPTGNRPSPPTRGIDHLTAVYVPADSRWWLCSSRFQNMTTFGHRFYSSAR